MADNWYDSVELPGGGDQGAQFKRNGAQEVVTNIVYVQGGWVTVPTTTDLNDLNVQRLYEGQVIYVSQSHELYITKKFQPGGYTVDGELQYAMSRSFHPLDFPHEGFNALSGSYASGSDVQTIINTYASGSDVQTIINNYASGSDVQGLLDGTSSFAISSLVTASINNKLNASINTSYLSSSFSGSNITFTGEVTMSNLEIEGHLETDTLSFDGVTFIAATTDFSDGSTVFGANASGALDPSSPQPEDLEPSDLNHKFTGSLLVTGGLEVNGTLLPSISTLQIQLSEGAFVNGDKTKLDGIESNATADQTAAEIRALVDSATDSNVFTNADHTKLDGIESNATADQTAEEIRTLVDSATDSNVFTDADHTKLDGISAGATGDQDLSGYQLQPSEGAFEDGDKTKLDGIEIGADVTDTTNVEAAGALMDSELTDLAGVKGVTISTLQVKPSEGAFEDGDKTKLDGIEAGATGDQDLSTYVTFTEASHSQVVPNPNYVSSSDITTSITDITELSYDSLVVSDIDIPLTNENVSPTITNGVVVGGNTTNGQYSFNVQTNLTETWPDVSTHIEGGISTIVNTVDNSDETTTRYNHQSEDFNFVFDFGTPRIVSEFRIRFQKEGELGSSVFEIPENIFIYGKNELFADGEDDGVFLGEGANPGNTNTIIFSSTPSSNPVSLFGIGTERNLSRTSSIAETSLTSSFQYYRVRFQKDTRNVFNQSNFTKIANITPVIRNFQESGTSISASNGVLNVNTIVTNNLIGTASFADFATTANSAISSSYAITASFVEGATNVTLTSVNSNITPDETDIRSLGTSDKKFKEIFAIDTFFGGIHEINLETKGLDKLQEGTILTLQNGVMCPCKKEADPLVMGVVSKGENYPIILGAEPVLVTGKVEEGDYIITSNIEGHGKGINPQHIYDKQLFGKIIAQAIEKGEGESYIIKAMIRKM